MRLLLSLALVGLQICAARAAVSSSLEAVKTTLSASGIKIGVDLARKRYVCIGRAERKIVDPANDPGFMKTRNDLAKVAELMARRDLLKAVAMNVSAFDKAEVVAASGCSARISDSEYRSLAERRLQGSVVLTSAESWDDVTKRYEITVAVAWSDKLETEGAGLSMTRLPTKDFVEESPEWEKWAKAVNLACVVGSRRFKDSQGVMRCVGVAGADIDGKRGPALRLAMRKAEVMAKGNLAYAINSANVTRDLAKSRVVEIEQGGRSHSEAWETFALEIARKAESVLLRAHEVYSTEVKHPITGRRMYVSVYGIEPDRVVRDS